MKKSVAAFWVIVVSFVLVILMTAEAKAQILDRTLSLRDLSKELKTPDDVARYMWHHFQFETDQAQFGKEEFWQTPDSMMLTRKGDCEDFAVFAHEILKLNGIPSFLLNIYGHRFAHTVCVFKENDRYNIIDGSRVIRLESKNFKDLLKRIYPFWKKSALVEPSEKSNYGKILVEFERQRRAEYRLATSA